MHLLKKYVFLFHYTIKHNNNLEIKHFSAGHIRVYSNRTHKSKFIIKFKLAWERDECWENFWRIQSKFRWISFKIKEFLTCREKNLRMTNKCGIRRKLIAMKYGFLRTAHNCKQQFKETSLLSNLGSAHTHTHCTLLPLYINIFIFTLLKPQQ